MWASQKKQCHKHSTLGYTKYGIVHYEQSISLQLPTYGCLLYYNRAIDHVVDHKVANRATNHGRAFGGGGDGHGQVVDHVNDREDVDRVEGLSDFVENDYVEDVCLHKC